jgi:hypothetical protein
MTARTSGPQAAVHQGMRHRSRARRALPLRHTGTEPSLWLMASTGSTLLAIAGRWLVPGPTWQERQ